MKLYFYKYETPTRRTSKECEISPFNRSVHSLKDAHPSGAHTLQHWKSAPPGNKPSIDSASRSSPLFPKLQPLQTTAASTKPCLHYTSLSLNHVLALSTARAALVPSFIWMIASNASSSSVHLFQEVFRGVFRRCRCPSSAFP